MPNSTIPRKSNKSYWNHLCATFFYCIRLTMQWFNNIIECLFFSNKSIWFLLIKLIKPIKSHYRLVPRVFSMISSRCKCELILNKISFRRKNIIVQNECRLPAELTAKCQIFMQFVQFAFGREKKNELARKISFVLLIE